MAHPILSETETPLKRRARKPPPHYTSLLLPLVTGASGLLLTSALPSLMGAAGAFDIAKCVLMGISGGITAYGVNRLALEKGAAQAATGLKGAAALSIFSILGVGTGFFTATYSGFTINEVDRLQLEAYGTEQAAYVEARQRAAMEAARVLPVLRGISAEFAETEECERFESCLSGRGSGGQGPVARGLHIEAERAGAIAAELETGVLRTAEVFEQLSGLGAAYQHNLADDSLTPEARRTAAREIAQQTVLATTTIAQSDPHLLAAGYGQELATPSGAPAEVERLRQSRASALRTIIDQEPRDTAAAPTFPARAGVSDTLAWMGHFLPIALIVAVVELVLPITLWLYAFFALSGRVALAEEEEEEVVTPKRARMGGGLGRV